MKTSRRQFFGLAAGGAALAAAPLQGATAQPVKTSARILILGAGAAGTALANQLSTRLDGAKITILDPRKQHWYQPGFTLIAAGLKPASYSVSGTADWLPSGVEWIEEGAAEIDPDGKKVVTESGKAIEYDFLFVATGLKLDYAAIEGLSLIHI
jgi:sulfide:quinone oxidoreductase